MISRKLSTYSSMVRRVSFERDRLGGALTLPNRVLPDGFMS